MKIDRLLGIITVLLQKQKVTASDLAAKFEVSRRTINRDIECLCQAGIPIVTLQGNKGGITISDNYKIDKTLFTYDELRWVLTGLLSLDSVSQDKKYQSLIEKFFPCADEFYSTNHMLIDLSSQFKNSLAPKIENLKNAIDSRLTVNFTYYNQNGEKQVALQPYFIVFKWSSWYVFGFEKSKEQFRLYKLNRLCGLSVTKDIFELRDVPQDKLRFENYFTAEIQTVIYFDKSQKFKLIEMYGADCYSVLPSGQLLFEIPFTNEDYLIEWVLSFGEKAQLIQPIDIKEKIRQRLQNALKLYL